MDSFYCANWHSPGRHIFHAVEISGDLCNYQNCDQVHIDDVSADDNGIDLRFVHVPYIPLQISC